MATKQLPALPEATSVALNDLLLKRNSSNDSDEKLPIQTFIEEALGSAATEESAVTPDPDTIAKRDSVGRVQSQSGGTGRAAVVDDDTSTSADADSVARRDSSGRLTSAPGGSGDEVLTWNDDVGAPAGAVQYFAMDTAPDGWLKANGAEISRSTYADLFSAIGTTFGAGNGSTTFNLPDLRGEFIRGWDNGRGVDPDSERELGSAQSDEIRSHSHDLPEQIVADAPNISGTQGPSETNDGFQVTSTFAFGGPETRPRNIALLACIKF